MKIFVDGVTIICGHLGLHMKRREKMEIEIVDGPDGRQTTVTNRECGKERTAPVTSFLDNVYHIVYCRFESLMDFDKFKAAIESHGFYEKFGFDA